MTFEFGLILQREGIREEFDEEIVSWSKAIIGYCRNTQTKSTAIQLVIKDGVCEFGGLEWWNGTVEWTTGVE